MLTARLQYQLTPGATYRYVRTVTMTATGDLQGTVITQQSWRVVEDRGEFLIVEVSDRLVSRDGTLSDGFQASPLRKVYLDGCGLLPKSGQDFADLSPFPAFPEESLEEGACWLNSEVVPNWTDPVDLDFHLERFEERGRELVAVIRSQARQSQPERSLEVDGRFHFAVGRGLLLESQIVILSGLPQGEFVRLETNIRLGD